MYSNGIDCQQYVDAVKEWDVKGETSKLVTLFQTKKDTVQVANAIRNAGYVVKVEEPNFCGLYQITVSKK